MRFGEAFTIAVNAGSGRKADPEKPDNVEQIDWTFGIMGLAVLVVVQAGLLFWSSSGLDPVIVRDLAFTAFAALAAPFVLFAIMAKTMDRMNRLPAAFLYLGVILAGLQIVAAVVSNFGSGSSGFLIGILGAVTYLAARGILKLSWPVALAVAIVSVIGFVGAGALLLLLPAGQLLR